MAEVNKNQKPKSKAKFKFDIKDPNVRNILIAVFVIGLCAYLWIDGVYSPAVENIAALTEEKSKLNDELVKINSLKRQLDKLRIELAEKDLELDSLRNMFPDDKEVAKLIRQITTVNTKSGVVTTRFTPKQDAVREYYVENKYDVAVAGDYRNLWAFFSSLANFQLVINLTNVSITANPGYLNARDDGPMSDSPPSVLANFELTTFSSKR